MVDLEAVKTGIIFGTRPEAIKMAPVVKVLQNDSGFEPRVIVTAQHREMLDQVMELFSISPDYDLDIMQHGQTLAEVTARVMTGIQGIIKNEELDLVLVHGDTTTTFASALAAFYQKICVGHVEAGLRSGNKYSPYPEEMNRKLTASLVDYHFAPTRGAQRNLLNEGIDKNNIFVTGNTVIDALLRTVEEDYIFDDPELDNLDFQNKRVILVTAHRRENWGQPMEEIFYALKRLSESHKDIVIVFPVHKNPYLQELAGRILGGEERIRLIQPLGYRSFVNLISRSYLVLTDSGGLQEEAPALGKPVLLMRDTTERPEALEAGTVRLVGHDKNIIVSETGKLLGDDSEYKSMSNAENPYGDGKASLRIRDWLLFRYEKTYEKPSEFESAKMQKKV